MDRLKHGTSGRKDFGARLGMALMVVLCAMVVSVARAENPVIPGDHPDPSIIRVGATYWMTSTSGDWSPQFVLYRSDDLQHWKSAGAVFPHQPEWASGSFWAPEIVSDGGRVLVYYVGRKRGGGPLCVAAATAAQPEGPYTDHGPMVCQQDGSIDPAFARDEHGKPYLIWKEDGNSQRKPTPIWAQSLTDDLVHLTGEKTQLIVNDPASWEGGVVEAPYVMRHAGYFYMFYAGNACCGTQCNYAEGVARSRHLLGPWEKDPANPIIRPNGVWRCPGHGSAVETPKGQDYFLYHAYPVKGTIYLGRESVLDRITWGANGWPMVNGGHGPSGETQTMQFAPITDNFVGKSLDAEWRWPVNREPKAIVGNGGLTLTVAADGRKDFVARSLEAPNYVAEVTVATRGATGSLAVIGNAKHAIGLGKKGDALDLWREDEGGHRTLWHGSSGSAGAVRLRVTSSDGGTKLAFAYSADGKQWKPAGEAIDVSKLPQWDQGLRVGLMVNGAAGETATFSRFVMRP